MTDTEIQKRGRALRSVINDAYERIANTQSGKEESNDQKDITSLVERSIPSGTKLPDAEAILHNAGLEIKQRPSAVRRDSPIFPPNSPFWNELIAEKAIRNEIGTRTDVIIILDVSTEHSPSTVSAVSAKIVVSYL